jgi:hypothetical protein
LPNPEDKDRIDNIKAIVLDDKIVVPFYIWNDETTQEYISCQAWKFPKFIGVANEAISSGNVGVVRLKGRMLHTIASMTAWDNVCLDYENGDLDTESRHPRIGRALSPNLIDID